MLKKLKEIIKRYSFATESIVSFLLMIGLIYEMHATLSNEYILALMLYIAVFVVVHYGDKNYNKRRLKYSLFFAVPFSFFICLGRKTAYQSMIIGSLSIIDVLLAMVLSAVFALIFINALAFIDRKSFEPKTKAEQLFKNKNLFWYVLIIILCWMPLFLIFFPGFISVDSVVQIRQAIGEGVWSNWHPVLYTLFIALPVNIGKSVFGDLTAGIALATITQMVILSLIFGYIVKWSIKKTTRKWIGICLLVFFALCPVVACYSITIWKDVLFSALFALLFIKIYDLLDSKSRMDILTFGNIIVVLVLTVLVGFLRNGGVLIMLALGIALFVYYKKSRKVIGLGFAAIILLTMLIQGFLYDVLGITGSPFMESMSVPAQQFGYVVKSGNMPEEVEKELSKFADIDCLGENYTPMNADPAKNCFDYEAVNDEKSGLIRVWFDLLTQRFPDYVNAYLLQMRSYWYIKGETWAIDFSHIHDKEWMEAEYTDRSLLGDFTRETVMALEKGLTSSAWLGWINNVGVLFWLTCFMLMVFIYEKKYNILVPMVAVLVYMLSLLIASPVSWIFRYSYSLLLLLPVLTIICFMKKKKERR